MPVHIAFHKGNALALQAVGDDRRGHALRFSRFLKRGAQLIEVMRVHVDHMEIEGFKLFVNGLRGADLVNRSVDLQAVVVHNHHQVVQLVKPANMEASQTCPSSISPSPSRV